MAAHSDRFAIRLTAGLSVPSYVDGKGRSAAATRSTFALTTLARARHHGTRVSVQLSKGRSARPALEAGFKKVAGLLSPKLVRVESSAFQTQSG